MEGTNEVIHLLDKRTTAYSIEIDREQELVRIIVIEDGERMLEFNRSDLEQMLIPLNKFISGD